MTMLHQDGFDSYATAADLSTEYGSVGADTLISATGGRYGGPCLVGAGGAGSHTAYVSKTLSGTQTEIWTGFAASQSDNQQHVIFSAFSLNGGINPEVSLWYNPLIGVFTAAIGQGNGNVIASGTCTMGQEVYHWIEIHLNINPTVGIFELWVDDQQIIMFAGNTASFGGTSIAALMLGGGNSLQALWDDWYILNLLGTVNNSRLGDSRIETLLASADAGPNQGIPSNGTSHFAMIDEVDIDYNLSFLALPNTVGLKEVFDFNPMVTTPANIWAVRVINVVEKTDGAVCNGAAYIESATVVGVGPDVPVLTTYFSVAGIFETDPATGQPWAYPAVNAINAGLELVA